MRTYLVAAMPPREDFDEQQAAALEVAGFPPRVWDRSGSIIGWPNRVRRYVRIDAETGDAARDKVAEVVALEASELQALEVPSQR
jgi:hypothetical protein